MLPPIEIVDVHSHARPAEVRTTHVDLDWEVDFERRELAGTATWKLERGQGATRVVLDTRDLSIEAVTDAGGRPLAHALGAADPILGAPLSIELPPGVTQVAVRYRTTSKGSCLQWLLPAQTAGKRAPYLFSQAQAIHARAMLPCQDSPGVRITYSAQVKVPAGLAAVMSADQSGPGAGPGRFRFAQTHAIPSYLIAIAVGDLAFRPLGPRSGVWAEPSVVDSAAREFSDLESMIDAVESMFGPYRWGRYDVLVLPPSFPFGGMENPCMTFATPTLLAGDKSLVNVIAHELAHSWSGNLVTNATWRDFWLNEGFTVYLERRILERIFGTRAATQDALLGRRDLVKTISELPAEDTRLFLDLSVRDPDDGLTDVAYEKGCLLLVHLERAFGREKFDAFLRTWFDAHAFQPVTTAEFERQVVARLCGGDPARAKALALEDWLHGQGLRADAPDFDREVFAEPTAAAESFSAASASQAAPQLPAAAKGWSTSEWLQFLSQLPPTLSAERLAALDRAWKLTDSPNAEIAAQWLEMAVRANYTPAYARLERFLVEIGRRKFMKPLYTELAKTPAGLERARAIYAKARPGYHPIAQATVDKLLEKSAAKQ